MFEYQRTVLMCAEQFVVSSVHVAGPNASI